MIQSLPRLLAGLLLLAVAAAAVAAFDGGAASHRFVSHTLTVKGAVATPLVLAVDDLRGFPPRQIEEVAIICESGANIGTKEHLRGVLLTDILDRAKLQAANPRNFRKMAVIAKATDDYKVVFSWAELFNSPLGAGVVVYFEKAGQPLGDAEGRIALISTQDTRTGPRHVRWLNEIEVRKVAD
ncbi:sulfite oxidase-like oxidoreductase [Thioflavicoccus mobilis 8321]|uniref:Sulfite oxidase-like oxidoreductase n=1 Tax=Thioflavicoccus mobilis 8321 TaxID=765912 RepID=L0GYL3_9GAMM|nr:molybdopterin-dependent oxidoreductase [Thioflavicoccus mobilis]AGA91868.1 sulfite oxidase-like oxidoreductase [Thioflavicoccus mobilis 8321]